MLVKVPLSRGTTLQGIAVITAVLVLACGCRSGSPAHSVDADDSIVMSIVPTSGSGSSQVFTASYSRPDDMAQAATTRLLINHDPDGRMACYVYFDRASNSFLLVNDAGDKTTRIARGAAAHLENSQCDLDGSASSVEASGNQLTMRVSLAFKHPFSGKMNVYLYSDDTGGKSTGFQKAGTWLIP